MTIVKNFMEKPFFLKMDFGISYEVLLRHKYFWSINFWQGNFFYLVFFKLPRKCVLFPYLFERNIATSPFMIHLKYTFKVLCYLQLLNNTKFVRIVSLLVNFSNNISKEWGFCYKTAFYYLASPFFLQCYKPQENSFKILFDL